MARKLRLEYPGAIYHVMNRGDRREAIFRDDVDHQLFLTTLDETCLKADWLVHAYCLMGNHFHLVLETPRGNLVSGMKWFLGTYTLRFNRRHGVSGHLFSGRYKALLVDPGQPDYLRTVCEYVHLNPVRAQLLRPSEPLQAYRWSSYPAYLDQNRRRPAWLQVERVLGGMGIPKDSSVGRKQFERLMEERRREENPEDYAGIRRGWCWGDDSFRQELLAQLESGGAMGQSDGASPETAMEKAERLAREELAKLGWKEADLAERRKGDAGKLKIALKLRAETTMTLSWIAGRLQMGTASSLGNLFSARRAAKERMGTPTVKP
jgi:REP element-mobilizing transposase RayT